MKLYKILFLLLFIPTLLVANDKNHEKSKNIRKTFSVNKNATLYINNKYGNINVATWNENRIEINVKITVKGNDLSNVERKLKAINVQFEATPSLIEARTIIEKTKSSWSWWGNNNTNYKINYFVKMPITNNADLNNKYGNIELDKLEGKSNINCDYGKIQIDQLLNETNNINLDYCGTSEINFMKSGNLSVDYSKLTIQKSENLKVNADYSTMKIGTATDVDFNSDYGSISIDDASNVNGNSDYASIKIGAIRKNLKINTDYGSVRVRNIKKGFESIVIDGSYAGIKLGTNSNNNFTFTVDLGYAGFGYPENYVNMFKSINKSSKKYYEGTFGKGNSNSTITIKSKYGGVSLKLND
ncbi:hypothetical protein SAMN05444344_1720 [Tenacibaculum mesophilum]|uniref:Adhesin n=1 Tax=Tenacibaculum mesophilum TaxID=104268 RepID=A0ABM7CDQ7_9FLAO|nr:hypothetical protein [Tenacibaculum mesophilum]AZJ31886.1 hypothetical protein D6200_04600 [Tenacibaculum mesophilum]QFS27141.1 hypothetical protein F9Y86_01470 [Tenacibaculum mesophilum]SHF85649.1 hypothetical protein SAMN05444344_1720 [Tenacibaculum mesophilum]